MGYSGAVSSEHSSGGQDSRGVESPRPVTLICVASSWRAAWSQRYNHGAQPSDAQAPGRAECRGSGDRIEGPTPTASSLYAPAGQGQDKQKVVTAVAREMLGFIWAIGVSVERAQAQKGKRRRIEARRRRVRKP